MIQLRETTQNLAVGEIFQNRLFLGVQPHLMCADPALETTRFEH